MLIAAQKVVTIAYTLRDDRGETLDTSSGGEPLAYLHGAGSIVPGLEKALEGRQAGERFEVTLAPAEGYGVRDETLIRNVPVRKLRGGKPAVGAQLQTEGPSGPQIAVVLALRGDYATIDGNHPLAGQTLRFEIEVVGVRDATAEEQAHGHPHGSGGHSH